MQSRLSVSLGAKAIDTIMGFVSAQTPELARREYEKALEGMKDSLSSLFQGFVLDDLTQTNTDMMVNVYGTEDILSKLKINGNALGGYRSSLAGFIAGNPLASKSLFNIEITGATHFDYMRRDDVLSNLVNLASPAAKAWNEKVAKFVTDLTINSSSPELLRAFLTNPPIAYRTSIQQVGDKWVITL